MAITKDDILHVANLARLEMDNTRLDEFSTQLGEILGYVEKLNRADTEGVSPTSNAMALSNAFREDVVRPHLTNEDALSNAPENEDGSFLVPKVIT